MYVRCIFSVSANDRCGRHFPPPPTHPLLPVENCVRLSVHLDALKKVEEVGGGWVAFVLAVQRPEVELRFGAFVA